MPAVATRPAASLAATAPTPPVSAAAPPRTMRWLGALLLALGSGLAVASLLGPAFADVIDYPVTTTLLDQTIGLDVVSLVLVVPACAVVGVLALRESPSAPLLALGPGLYVAYMAVQYILGPDHLGREGNSARFFPLYLALTVTGLAVAVVAWNAGAGWARTIPRQRARLIGGLLLPVGLFLAFFRYLPALADAMSDSPSDTGYLAGPVFFWTIATLDLGLALPAGIAACIGLLRGARWAPRALAAVVGWFALVGPAVAGMGIAMYVNDDPNASAASAAAFGLLACVFVALAVFAFAVLLRSEPAEAP